MSGKQETGLKARLTRWVQITTVAYKSWAALLGSILGCIALCNLVVRFFSVSITEMLGWILTAYQQTFYPPIDLIFAWLPVTLSPTAKDAILLYLATGGVLYRSITYGQPKLTQPTSWRGAALRLRMHASHIVAALLWPKVLKSFFVKPCLLVSGADGFQGRLPYLSREEASGVLSRLPGNLTVFCDERELVISYFVSLIAAVLALVTVNAAVNELTARLAL